MADKTKDISAARYEINEEDKRDKLKYHVEGIKRSLPLGLGQVDYIEQSPIFFANNGYHFDKLPKINPDYKELFPLYDDKRVYTRFNEDFFILNDIEMGNIPCTAMKFESNSDVFIAETLRSSAPVVTSKGIQNWTLDISFAFPPGERESQKLKRLIGTISKNPLVYIYNPRIRKALGLPDDDSINTIFILENASLNNMGNQAGAISLSMTLHFFNYKPFSNHYWYNARLPGYVSKPRETEVFLNKRLDQVTGYESSTHSISYDAQWIIDNIREGLVLPDQANNVPVPFPAASDSWMHYADHLESSMPSFNDRTNDHVTFNLRYFSHHNPPSEAARAGSATATEAYVSGVTFGGYPEIYNAMNPPQPVEQAAKGYTSSNNKADNADAEGGSQNNITQGAPGVVSLCVSVSGEREKVKLVNEDGSINMEGHSVLSRLMIDKRNNKNIPPSSFKCDPELCKRLSVASANWPGKELVIISGVRKYGEVSYYEEDKKDRNGKIVQKKGDIKPPGPHRTGGAIDFYFRGISVRDLFLFMATNFKSGFTEYCPNSTPPFVHIDARPEYPNMILDCDISKTGEKSKYDKNHESILEAKRIRAGKSYKSGTSLEGKAASDEEANHREGVENDNEQASLEQQKSKADPAKQGDVWDPNQKQAEQQSVPPEVEEQKKIAEIKARSPEARFVWKEEMYKQWGLVYYDEDPKVRNVFYSNLEQRVDSNSRYENGGIVLSAVQISFGHRIVPQRLLSQDTYTWQFLGAGNKQGTMVFTFSGIDGRMAADRIKQIVYSARENARKFGPLIPSASAIELVYTDFETNTSNSILAALAGKNNTTAKQGNRLYVIVSSIEETATNRESDTYQMTINFIVQDFAEEKRDKRFEVPLEEKKKIISSLMRMLVAVKLDASEVDYGPGIFGKTKQKIGFGNQWIKPKSKYLEDRYNTASLSIKAGLNAEEYGRPYKLVDKNMPIWLANILIDLSALCRETDESIPPVTWHDTPVTTWRDKWKQWDPEGIIKGRAYRIDEEETSTTVSRSIIYQKLKEAGNGIKTDGISLFGEHYLFLVEEYRKGASAESLISNQQIVGTARTYFQEIINRAKYESLSNNNFNNDAIGKNAANANGKTNKTAAIGYNIFLEKVNIFYERVKEQMSDKEAMERYFGDSAKKILSSLVSDLGGCYEDMDLPVLPGKAFTDKGLRKSLALPLPPEFYIFDDSKEDPAISNINDKQFMNRLLKNHLVNEKASIDRYLIKSLLGGSYLSRNLPQILNDRKRYLDEFAGRERTEKGVQGELKFIGYSEMMNEGCKAWEPIYHRAWENTDGNANKWMMETAKDGQSNEDDVRFSYMDKITKLSPYLGGGNKEGDNAGHPGWSFPESAYGKNHVIDSIYGDNWKALSFGPNQQFINTDNILEGVPSTQDQKELANESKKEKTNLQKNYEISDAAKESGKSNIDSGNRVTYLSTGEILLGDSLSAEKTKVGETKSSNTVGDTISSITEGVGVAGVVGSVALGASTILTAPITLPASAYAAAAVGYGLLAYGSSVINFDIANDNTKNYLELSASGKKILENIHPESKKYTEEEETKKLSEYGSSIAFMSKSKDKSMRRTFPTFKIYFIEDDSHQTELQDQQVVRAFDDFYSYSSIQEIRISRNRKVAADMATIRMTNISGILLRTRFGEKEDWQIQQDIKYGRNSEYANGIFADTERENPFERMILKEGVKVQIRLGYANEPDNLETVFLGAIAEVSPSEGGRILEISCQGFGAELEGVELGPLEDGPLFYSSQQVLSGAIIQDSIVNFGRRSKFNKFNPGEARHSFFGGKEEGTISSLSPAAFVQVWGNKKLFRFMYKYPFLNYPQDDNIYAPPPSTYAGFWEKFWDNACLFRPIKQTPWQIFKEHELRHPGYISMAVPYGHDPRMTMFFGAKGQHYWSKPPSALEIHLSEAASDSIIAIRGMSTAQRTDPSFLNKLESLVKASPDLASAIIEGMTSFVSPANIGKEVGKLFGRYIPFRNYHYFDSYHHILKNTIGTTSNIYNQVEVLYFDDENQAEEDDAEILYNNIQKLARGEFKTFSCKLDENIPEQYIKSYTQGFPSCLTEFMAKRYAQGLFARLLRDAYRGEFIILGDATIKPYDICFINDQSVNMTGPIEVQGIEHIFNRDHGWISIITPDMCIDVNEFYSASVMDMAGSALSSIWGSIPAAAAPLAPIAAIASPFAYLGLVGGIKFAMWMQEGSPVISTPLSLGGKPFISAAIGQDRVSLIRQLHGEWNQWWDDAEENWRKLDIAETVFDTSLDFKEKILGWVGDAPGNSIKKAE